ncbi:hypothetical protein SSX86_029754 [Deinandra increscens subsp. villosa]|uniref:Homeobox domain-containing protein n=1 Tax=Deinandra increscens subsp. villosa TaxID=3103831 RepID=A0AAP0CH26_9ASTR
MIAGAEYFDESSCEPSHEGLSLSLSSTNPNSTIIGSIQPFELHVTHPQNHQASYYGKPPMNIYDHHMIMTNIDQDGVLIQSGNAMINSTTTTTAGGQHHHYYYNLRSSRYLVCAQDLLNELCNLGTKQNDYSTKAQRTNHHHHDNFNNMDALNSLEFLELQKRKSKLLQMLDEVDRKYHNYCDQMKAVVSSFEAVAGNGAARVYSTLASKAMSRHFKCLKDGIVGQIMATKKAMGEKDISAPGPTRGETPRLRLLDQTLRQQRAFQQMTMLDSQPWRPQRGLPERSVTVLRSWLFEHFLNPYPSDVDKHILARQTSLSRSQVSNWFINARVRLWKPMVEEMYLEETKDNDHEKVEGFSERFNASVNENITIPKMEQKPMVDQLIRRDSDCLFSIINHHDQHTTKNVDHDFHQSQFQGSRPADCFGEVELDFSTYNHNFGSNGGGGVSLTLGLHGGGGGGGGGGGVSLYYPRDHVEDCQTPIEYISSVLEGDQGQNLPYRNLMGSQLLHDLAG